jgi:hypothetical protein
VQYAVHIEEPPAHGREPLSQMAWRYHLVHASRTSLRFLVNPARAASSVYSSCHPEERRISSDISQTCGADEILRWGSE